MIAFARAGRERCYLAVQAETVDTFGTHDHGLRQAADT